ncbi:MAG TPA: hydrogenase 3 maturation endopeptidase HyCI [Spirochaetota bacterium]|nr:hydrogenase 3 maturation endopeptidase HyCI [Spirochaetota bacterium]HPJ39941.1 hydrogenase 3 maturation endopeptidase HyCI [Spirochaetota bacterium]
MKRHVLLGIGNRLRSDDGAGSILAEMFEDPQWLAVDGDIMPENFTGVIRKENPDLLIIADACSMNEPPGTFRRIPVEHLSSEYGFNTHNASVRTLIEYMREFAGEILFIGIQPGTTAFGESLSGEVRDALQTLADILKKGNWNDIPEKE